MEDQRASLVLPELSVEAPMASTETKKKQKWVFKPGFNDNCGINTWVLLSYEWLDRKFHLLNPLLQYKSQKQ
jgi:hypothetical protein